MRFIGEVGIENKNFFMNNKSTKHKEFFLRLWYICVYVNRRLEIPFDLKNFMEPFTDVDFSKKPFYIVIISNISLSKSIKTAI